MPNKVVSVNNLFDSNSAIEKKSILDQIYRSASSIDKGFEKAQKIVSLEAIKNLWNITDVTSLAEREALIVPKPPKNLEVFSQSVAKGWSKYSSYIQQFALQFFANPFSEMPNIKEGIKFYWEHPPSSFQGLKYVLKRLVMPYIGLIGEYYWTFWTLLECCLAFYHFAGKGFSFFEIYNLVTNLFTLNMYGRHGISLFNLINTTEQKTDQQPLIGPKVPSLPDPTNFIQQTKGRATDPHAFKKDIIIAIAVTLYLSATTLIYHAFKGKSQEVIRPDRDKSSIFDLNQEVRDGRIHKSMGFVREKNHILQYFNVVPGRPFGIPIFIGPPGCGKTQVIEGLTYEIEEGSIPSLKGKTVLCFNGADIAQKGPDYLDSLWDRIENHEDDYILFIDEVHGFAGCPGLLNKLKTSLTRKNIRICFATTLDEYKQYLATDPAFIERLKPYKMESLSDPDTKTVLERTFITTTSTLTVEEDALDATLTVASKHPDYQNRANPRKAKDILDLAERHVNNWEPSSLTSKLSDLGTKLDRLERQCLSLRNKDPNWSSSNAANQVFAQIQILKGQIQQTRNQQAQQVNDFAQITAFKNTIPLYAKQEAELIHKLARSSKAPDREADEKKFLLLKYSLLPYLRAELQRKVDTFTSNYGERVPLQVNADTLKKLFPECFKVENSTQR